MNYVKVERKKGYRICREKMGGGVINLDQNYFSSGGSSWNSVARMSGVIRVKVFYCVFLFTLT